MAIVIVCPGCRKRFSVSDQFAGRTGPCPSCKAPIKIPSKGEEVQVHAPEQFGSGGKSATGALILKPIERTDVKFDLRVAVAIAGVSLVVMILTLLVRRWGVLGQPSWTAFFVQALGLLLISPPLVVGGYSFLRDDELEPYRGRELLIRAGIVALAFTILWGFFGRIGPMVLGNGTELWLWLIVAPPFLVTGALTALGALDLDFGSGFFLYFFYLLATILLRAIAGLGWIWQFTGT